MTSVALTTVAPIIYNFVKDALIEDNNHFYGLLYAVDYGVIKTDRFEAFDYEDDLFLIQRIDEHRSKWWIKSFDAEKKYWGGTSFLKDGGSKNLDCLFRASLFHDCGYSKVEALSKATGIPEKDLLAFFDDCFKILSEGYGASKVVTNPIYQALRFGGSIFHKVMKWFSVILVLMLCGCYTIKTEMEGPPPEIHWDGPFFNLATNQTESVQNAFLTNSVPQNDKIIVQTHPNASTHVLDDSSAVLGLSSIFVCLY